MPDAPVKHIKALTLNKQERIVMAEEKTKERLLVVDFFKDVLTATINANGKGVLQQLVLALNESASDRLVQTLIVAKASGGITKDCAVDADKTIEFLNGATPKAEGLLTEEFCKQVQDYLKWKKNNDEIMMQLFRDVYVHERGLKKGILLEVSMEAGSLLAAEEAAKAKKPPPGPSRDLKSFILDNLKMLSEVEQDQLEGVKDMMRLFWPGLSGDTAAQTDLYKKMGGNLNSLDKDQVQYWGGYLGLRVMGDNDGKLFWYDCFGKDRTQEVTAKQAKENELLMSQLHESSLAEMLPDEEEAAPEQVEAKPDDSKVFYGAAHKVSTREPIRLLETAKVSDLKVRATFEAPKPQGLKGKVDYYAFICEVLAGPKDPEPKQTLGFNELVVGSFYDEKTKAYAHYIVRTRSEYESIIKANRNYQPEKLRICEFDTALKNALPPTIRKDARIAVVERTQQFLSQNRGKIPGVLAALKAGKAEGLVAALMEYVRALPSPEGKLAYDLRVRLKKVLSAKARIIPAKQEFQTQLELQNKLLVQTQNEIKTGQTAQRIQAFKAKLAAQVKVTAQAKNALDVHIAPLIQLVNQAYQERQLQPKPASKTPPKAKPVLPGQPAFAWETVIPWEKLAQLARDLAEKTNAHLTGAKVELKLPESDRDITDLNLDNLINSLNDLTMKSTKDPVGQLAMVMAETLADYVASLDEHSAQQMVHAMGRLADEMFPSAPKA
jgi:hypothetical protein